jgi:hypothetical protein
MARRSIALLVLCLGALFVAPMAQADTGDTIEGPQSGEPPAITNGWQSANCISETPQCSAVEPAQLFKVAGGHPAFGFTQYIVQHEEEELEIGPGEFLKLEPIKEPLEKREIKTLRTDLPPGLAVNAEATGEGNRCSNAEFLFEPAPKKFVPQCKPSTQTGVEKVTLVVNKAGFELEPGKPLPRGFVIPPTPGLSEVPVYNLVPEPGEPVRSGFVVGGENVVILTSGVAWESDFHEYFTIHLHQAPVPGLSPLISRHVSFGKRGKNGDEGGEVGEELGTYISNPTTCFNPAEPQFSNLYATWFRSESFEEPNPTFPEGSTAFKAPTPPGEVQEGCDSIPFEPAIKVDPGTPEVDSPSPATVTTEIPFENPEEGGGEVVQSQLRSAKVTLPAGMGLNPAASKDLVACTDGQFDKGKRIYNNSCPANSIIGTAALETNLLPKGTLKGNVYVGEQKSSDPTSGEEFRILVEAKSEEYGTDLRLIGNVSANPTTGQLTAKFDEKEIGPLAGPLPEGLPQAPFESLKLHFNGPNAVLSSPPTCAAAKTTSEMEPWARPGTHESPTDSFTLSSVPGGGSCPQTLAQRSFAPSYTAATESTKAGAYSPFKVHIGRPDGQQEVKLVNVTLPKGLTGNLSGIPYCSEAALAAAAASSGKAQQASSSCPAESMVGTDSTESGTGATPVKLPGKVFLAGPYKGAPLSLAAITPAVSGPFDLGTVVVRVALNVNPETAQINAVSDTIPDVFGGVKLDIRSIDFNLDRAKFMLNPTNCAAQATSGAINGAGGDATNPAAWSSYAVNAPFQASQCNKLGFKPKLHTRLYGPVKRAKNPRIRAILEARQGDANVSRTALTLPHSLFLDQSHIRTVCTRVQLAAQACPQAAVYGHAEAKTPLLSNKLKGPVYLVSSSHELPDLVADLRGQVNIQLHGVISSKHGGLKTVFNPVPDVPVTKFILNMQGGKKSLLVNSENLCKSKQRAVLNIGAQNGKKVKNNKYPLNISSCGGKKK